MGHVQTHSSFCMVETFRCKKGLASALHGMMEILAHPITIPTSGYIRFPYA